MTPRLRQAFDKISQLPLDDQDFLARRLLVVLEAKHIWQATSDRSPEFLSKLADELTADSEGAQID